ncbi:MAG: nucleoside monophosphate kinase [Candidatus Liptonbacteria bacterium]
MTTPEVIFIMGPQGSGKGTQARVLAGKLNMYYWEMGGILRASKNFVLKDGKTVGEIIDRGIYLTDDQLGEIVRPKFKLLPVNQGIIFDGIPRRLSQAEFLLGYLKDLGKKKYVDFVY